MTRSTFSSSSFPQVPLPALSTLRNIVTRAPEPLRPLARHLLNTLNPTQGIKDDDYYIDAPGKVGEYSDKGELNMSVESLLSEDTGLEEEREEGWVDVRLEEAEDDAEFEGRKKPDGQSTVKNEEDRNMSEQEQEADAVRRWKEDVGRERHPIIRQRIANPKNKVLSIEPQERLYTNQAKNRLSQARTQEQMRNHPEPLIMASRPLLPGHVIHSHVARPRKFSDCRVSRPLAASPQLTHQRQDNAESSTPAPRKGAGIEERKKGRVKTTLHHSEESSVALALTTALAEEIAEIQPEYNNPSSVTGSRGLGQPRPDHSSHR